MKQQDPAEVAEVREPSDTSATQYRRIIDAQAIGGLQWRIAALLTGTLILDGLTLQLVGYSAPVIMSEWQLTKVEMSPVLGAAMIGMAVGTPIGSFAGDRFGRKVSLIGSLFFFGLMTLICAALPSAETFIAGRFLSGIGLGAAFPVATVMMSEWMPRRVTGKAISLMTIGVPAGGLLGATIASWIVPHMGWRVTFVGASAMSIGLAIVMLSALPESPSFLALRGRTKELSTHLARAWRTTRAAGDDALEVRSEEEDHSPLFSRHNARLNIGLTVAVSASYCFTFAVLSWIVIVLTDMRFSLELAIMGPLVWNLAAMTGAVAGGWIIQRLGSRKMMLGAGLLATFAAVLLAIITGVSAPSGTSPMVIFICLAVAGLCSGAVQPSGFAVAANGYNATIRSRGVGLAALAGRCGSIASSFLGGLALALAGEAGFFLLVAILAGVFAAGTLIIDRHIPETKGARRG